MVSVEMSITVSLPQNSEHAKKGGRGALSLQFLCPYSYLQRKPNIKNWTSPWHLAPLKGPRGKMPHSPP